MKMAPVHNNFRVLKKKRFEKREPHQVVPVAVGEEKIVLIPSLIKELITAAPHTGSRIDNDNIITLGPDLKAGGIPSILDIFRPGNRYGAPCAPTSNNHRSPLGLHCKLTPDVV
jgi:hypothetical protein